MTSAREEARGLAIALLLVVGCGGRDIASIPCEPPIETYRPSLAVVDKVDLLLVMDDSSSTTTLHTLLAQQLPRILGALTTGDADPDDGISIGRDFEPVRSLNVGVVTSDMGTDGIDVPTCDAQPFGNDGILRTTGNTALDPACAATYPPFLTYAPHDDVAELATQVACLSVVGTRGCGFEQPLEALLKAVTPSTQAADGAFDGRFLRGTPGHADGANVDFLRPDAVLAIVLVTDEDDCSALDTEVYDETSSTYEGDLNLRCPTYASALHPIERYVDGLLATRDPHQLVFVPLAGIPAAVASQPEEAPDYDAILSHPAMEVRIDPALPTRLAPSCNEAGVSFAFPPRRILEVARGLHERGVSTAALSICVPDYSEASDAIVHAIGGRLGSCFGRDLALEADGRLPCELIETSSTEPGSVPCGELPGRTSRGIDEETGLEECLVTQLATDGAEPEGDGWYYDTFSATVRRFCADAGPRPARIRFTDGDVPPWGGHFRLECREPITGSCLPEGGP